MKKKIHITLSRCTCVSLLPCVWSTAYRLLVPPKENLQPHTFTNMGNGNKQLPYKSSSLKTSLIRRSA